MKIGISRDDGAVSERQWDGGGLKVDLLDHSTRSPKNGIEPSIFLRRFHVKWPLAEQANALDQDRHVEIACRTEFNPREELAKYWDGDADGVAGASRLTEATIDAAAMRNNVRCGIRIE